MFRGKPLWSVVVPVGLVVAVMLSALVAKPTSRPAEPVDKACAGYKRIFNRMDANGDGVLTQAEYVARTRWDEKRARAIWTASDANRDGKVTEAEYCDNRRVTDDAKAIFVWLDTDRNGKVSEQEMTAGAKRIFAEMDRDGSGEATIPEALGARWQWQVRIQWAPKREMFKAGKAGR